MTLLEIRTQVLRRMDEDTTSPVYVTAQLVDQAINEGLNIFSTLTLCVEKSATITITDTFTDMIAAAVPRLIVPLKLYRGATRIHPERSPGAFAAAEVFWRTQTGAAKRYAMMGATLLVLDLKPTSGTNYTMTYAATAGSVAADGDVPEIPLEDHSALVDFAVWRLLAISGGAEFVAAASARDRFLDIAKKRAGLIRVRFQQLGYDRTPPELEVL